MKDMKRALNVCFIEIIRCTDLILSYLNVTLESILNIYRREVRSKRSKDPVVKSLDELEAVATEHHEKFRVSV